VLCREIIALDGAGKRSIVNTGILATGVVRRACFTRHSLVHIMLFCNQGILRVLHSVLSPSRHSVEAMFTLIFSVVILYHLLMSFKHGYVILKKVVLKPPGGMRCACTPENTAAVRTAFIRSHGLLHVGMHCR
jgi:hypothetical protein